MDYRKLFHEETAFQRETFEARMLDYGFKNIGRMELFLWDLELFLQIQHRLGDRVVLKGGAATQFYLPKEAQRTSVDIDMLFAGTESEIVETLNKIEASLGEGSGLFHFRRHIPKNPKTTLPLFRNGIKADEYVFKDEKGKTYDANIFRKQLQLHNASQRNGYIFKPHECRYRIVIEMMQDGIPADKTSDFLGLKGNNHVW